MAWLNMNISEIHPAIAKVTAQIAERSETSRTIYLEMIRGRHPKCFSAPSDGLGRELFSTFRSRATGAGSGASLFSLLESGTL